jgi:hypothetical protein
MTYPLEDVMRVAAILRGGALRAIPLTNAEVGRRTGVSRAQIGKWRREGFDVIAHRRRLQPGERCPGTCIEERAIKAAEYAYLLGMYLGDGCISRARRNVFVLRITCDLAYPGIMDECSAAMSAVLPNRVSRVRSTGCLNLQSSSKHWPCVIPQFGPGRKHERKIELADWQRRIALAEHPERFLRGLIHSDGSRFVNNVVRTVAGEPKRYEYVRYQFSNRSADIRAIFAEVCARLGVETRPSNDYNLSVARRSSVAILDALVGAKQ